jgi:hypothetical protein
VLHFFRGQAFLPKPSLQGFVEHFPYSFKGLFYKALQKNCHHNFGLKAIEGDGNRKSEFVPACTQTPLNRPVRSPIMNPRQRHMGDAVCPDSQNLRTWFQAKTTQEVSSVYMNN